MKSFLHVGKDLQFKGDSLQSLGRTLHDLLAGKSRTSEGDLIRARMGGKPRAKVVITTQDLDDTGREVLLCEFNELQIAIRGEWRWFDNDGVSGNQCRGNLAASKMDREVPWYNTHRDTEGSISNNDLLVVVFLDDLFLELDFGQFANPVYSSLHLSDGELVLNSARVSENC